MADRWALEWPEDALPAAVVLGDHAAARYRHFRRFVEALGDEDLDHALFGLLLSAESMRDEMRAYEQQTSWALRLAHTGHFVRQLQRLHSLLDAMSEQYDMKEPEGMSEWESALKRERNERVKRYRVMLASPTRSDVNGGSGEGTVLLNEIESEEQQEEALTLLKAAIDKYGDDLLTPEEIEVTIKVFQVVADHLNMVVMSLPSWLVMPFEFHSTFGLSRWGNDVFVPDDSDKTRFIQDANVWSSLNHPHVAKFLGACHVGSQPFIAHERVRRLSEYVREEKNRQQVWRRLYEVALALQYLHQRGLGCAGRLTLENVFCAEFESKAMLFGAGLVSCGDDSSQARGLSRSARAAADVDSLCVLVLNCLRVVSSPTSSNLRVSMLDDANDRDGGMRYDSMPTTRPDFLKEDEWVTLIKIRQVDTDSTAVMLHVIELLKDLAGAYSVRDPFSDGKSWDCALGVKEGVIQIGSVVVPELGRPIPDILSECSALAKKDDHAAPIQRRLYDIYSQLKTEELRETDGKPAKELVVHFASLLVRHYRAMDQHTGCSDSFVSPWSAKKEPESMFSFHKDIDRFIDLHDLSRSNEAHAWEPDWEMLRSKHQVMPLSALILHPSLQAQHHNGSQAHLAEALSGHTHVSASLGRTRAPIEQSKLASWFLSPTEIEFKSFAEFSRGSFGSVHHGKWFDTRVVVKQVFTDTGEREKIHAQFLQEADTWFQLNHINVVKMYGACHIDRPFFVCEYVSGGDLSSYLRRKNRDPYLIWYSLLNAALGLQYLHDKGIVHADLKANNILVGADGIAKLADFGLSVSRRHGIMDESVGGGARGAFPWKAPECLPWNDVPGKTATFASDVYSFAMVMIEVASGTFPWRTLPDLAVIAQVKGGVLPMRPAEIADSEWQLIERMCCLDPAERVTIDSVVVHLSSLLERMDMARLWSPTDGRVAPNKYQNRVLSRGGALLSLIELAKSTNAQLAWYATEHLIAIQVNRGAQSEKREIEALIELVRSGSDAEKAWAAGALGNLSVNDDNKVEIASCGGIPPLVSLVRDGNDEQKERAARALGNLSMKDDNKMEIASCGGIPPLVAMLRDGNANQKENAAGALWNLAEEDDESQALIVSSGGIPPLVALLRDGNDDQKVEAAGTLRNLAKNSKNRVLIASSGGISPLVAPTRSRRMATPRLSCCSDQRQRKRKLRRRSQPKALSFRLDMYQTS